MKYTREAKEIEVLTQEAIGVEQEIWANNDDKYFDERQAYLIGLYQSIGKKVVDVRHKKMCEKTIKRCSRAGANI